MNVIDQILNWLGAKPTPPEKNPAHELLEAGQRTKRAEDFPTALQALSRAAEMAELKHDLTALAVITLHQAEIYIYQTQWTEAEQLLLSLRHKAQSIGQRTQMAYTLDMLGTLAQAKSDWGEARAYFEQALKVARAAGSLGGEGRALGHLADTYLEENNASYAVYLLRDSVTKLNMSGDIEYSSYFVARLGHALILSGQESEGEHLLKRALNLAEQMRHRRYERICVLLLGERALISLRYEDALTYYQRASALLDTAEHQREHITTLCHLSKISLNLQNMADALAYAQEAVEASKKIEEFELKAIAQGALGIALRASGQSEKAITHLETAAENYRQINNNSPIEILRNLGAAQADTDDERAIATYIQAIEAAQTLNSSLELAQAHLELGLVYARHKQMQTAIQEWVKALGIYEAERYYAQVARLRCDIGNARKYLGQGQRAMKEYEQALMTLNSIDDWTTRGIVLSNAANAYADQGDIDSADAFFSESITIASQIGDREAEATRRGNYGWFLHATGRSKQAVSTLEYAIRLSDEQKLDLQVAVQTDNLGLAHSALGNNTAALSYHEQALEQITALNEPHWKSIIQINLANSLLGQSRIDEAADLLDEALREGGTREDIEVIIRALTGQARIALVRGQVEESGVMLSQAVTQARRADMRRLLAEALRTQSEQQAAINHPEQSLLLWDEAQKLFNMLHTPVTQLQPQWLTSLNEK
jgi:tetratricopeptide (TPR) repeat protein